MSGTPVGVLATWLTFPIVKSKQIINAKSITELETAAMMMLRGIRVRTFFASSPSFTY